LKLHARKTPISEPRLIAPFEVRDDVMPFSRTPHVRVRLTKAAKQSPWAAASARHVMEFGGRHTYGHVIGRMFSEDLSAPEIDVRWYPSRLRYGYNPSYLERA
jgi:hypothetical protein